MTAAGREYTTERWTYGGTAPGTTRAKVAIWYDDDRTRMAFAPDRAHQIIGGVYEVQVSRGDGHTYRSGDPKFTGRHDDTGWVAQLEAGAYAAAQDLARAQLERRAARDSELDDLLAPVVEAAAGMSYAQRDALIALISRKVYRANKGGR